MDQRTQRQLKALQNKLVNVNADITILEKELNLADILREKEQLTAEQTAYTSIINEEQDIRAKIDGCILKIKEYEGGMLDAEFDKKKALYDEQEIYDNEQARIAFAFGEWQTYMKDKLTELLETRKNMESILAELNEEKSCIDTVICNYSGVKRDLRLQNMNMILAQQLAYKHDKELYKTHTDTVAGLLLEKSQFARKVNTYTQDRYNINNDYYTWKCECEHVEKHAAEDALFEARAKLSRDPRQDYALRYMKLDADLAHSQNMINRIDKQLSKLEAAKKEKPIIRLNKNVDEHAVLAEYQIAKQACCGIQQQIEQQMCMIESIQREIDMTQNSINSGQRPEEIIAFEHRAKQRLSIMTDRINKKYKDTVEKCDSKIDECRQLMATYQKKYENIIENKTKKGKDMGSIISSINDINGKLERQTTLTRLIQDRDKLLESISQLSV
jgi:chromosome segregation ATPase